MLWPLTMLLATAQTPSSPDDLSAACAKSDTVRIAPAVMLDLLDQFRAGLGGVDRERLDRVLLRDVDGGIAQCDGVEGSRASCEASAYMPALRSTGLMPRFLATICRKQPGGEPQADHSAPTFIPHHTMPPR